MSELFLAEAMWRAEHPSAAAQREHERVLGELAANWSRLWRRLARARAAAATAARPRRGALSSPCVRGLETGRGAEGTAAPEPTRWTGDHEALSDA